VKNALQDISGRHDITFGASEMLLSCQLQKACIKFHNNNLIVCKDMTLYTVTEFAYIHSGSAFVTTYRPTYKFETSSYLTTSSRKNNINKPCIYVHDLYCTKVHSSKYNGS
jgi:hypothetical protein